MKLDTLMARVERMTAKITGGDTVAAPNAATEAHVTMTRMMHQMADNAANRTFWRAESDVGPAAGGFGWSVGGFGWSAGSSLGAGLAGLAQPAQPQLMAHAVMVEEPSREMLKRVEPMSREAVQSLDLADPLRQLAVEAEALLGYTPLLKAVRAPGSLQRALAKLEIAVLDQASVDQYKAQMADHYLTAGKLAMPTWRLTEIGKYPQPVPEFVLQKAVEIKRELPEARFYIDQLAVDPFLIVSLDALDDYFVNTKRNLNPERAAYVEVWAEPKFEAEMESK